jgi:hypothetical protein
MSLTNWHAAGWLVEHRTTPEELRDLFAVAERDLKDSAVTGISSDTQRGMRITGHLCSVGFREAAALGIDDLEGGTGYDSAKLIDAARGTVGIR